jgi:hypothetical protein
MIPLLNRNLTSTSIAPYTVIHECKNFEQKTTKATKD